MTHEVKCKLIDALSAPGDPRSDREIAADVGCGRAAVGAYRRALGRKAYSHGYDWTGVDLSRPAPEIASCLGCSLEAVYMRRRKVGAKAEAAWSANADAAILAREQSDAALAVRLKRTPGAIRQRRWRLRRATAEAPT